MKVNVNYDYGYVGTDKNVVLEFSDDTTDEEINEYIWEMITQQINIYWEKLEGDKND